MAEDYEEAMAKSLGFENWADCEAKQKRYPLIDKDIPMPPRPGTWAYALNKLPQLCEMEVGDSVLDRYSLSCLIANQTIPSGDGREFEARIEWEHSLNVPDLRIWRTK